MSADEKIIFSQLSVTLHNLGQKRPTAQNFTEKQAIMHCPQAEIQSLR